MDDFDEKLTIENLEKDLKKIQRQVFLYQELMRDTSRMVEIALIRQSAINGLYEERKRQGVQNA